MSLAKLQDLHGRIALVTGGSRGLGLQMAEALGELGAKVAITARKADELEEARAHLQAMGIEALPIVCDMGKLENIPAMVEQVIAGLGPIDILVNNAGTTWGAATIDHSIDAWNKVITLNLSSIFVASQEVGKRCMVPRRSGKVINIASVQGLSGGYPEGMPTLAYNASKGGVVNLTRALAKEWAAHDINVNAIAPGYFATKMTKYILDTQHGKTEDLAPLKRTGGPEDLKGVTALLASDACSFITGQIIAVDGGLTAVF
ncbi:SDR family oxidoreductase [Variovorax sp. 770b2]|uniref:SDR family oxidoreductase n=1 Tax=Variovorax sp. 770b2 TaxID=1566271 RepID=UPI0008F0D3E8|nr:SDR family oxidoreductase [Variovorax sp. 770b2]SFQ37243.1 gluconate 5-dehydrogenase [Variovorax sp. 770b2]